MFKIPKSDSKYHWTNHVTRKMVFYGLSPDRVKRIIRNPKRIEKGIAENTIAVMSPGSNINKPSEIWVMYSLLKKASTLSERSESKGRSFGKTLTVSSVEPLRTIGQTANRKIVISAWRYPGVSPIGKAIPIPQDILNDLKEEGIMS